MFRPLKKENVLRKDPEIVINLWFIAIMIIIGYNVTFWVKSKNHQKGWIRGQK